MMRLAAACRNTSVSRTTGTAPEAMMSAKHLPRPDRRRLVDVADDEESRVAGGGLQQRLHQEHVDHGSLVDDKPVAVQTVAVVAPEATISRVDLEKPMDRLGFDPSGFNHPLGGAAGWSAKQHPDALELENAQGRIDEWSCRRQVRR
jgi:hypothetical protein